MIHVRASSHLIDRFIIEVVSSTGGDLLNSLVTQVGDIENPTRNVDGHAGLTVKRSRCLACPSPGGHDAMSRGDLQDVASLLHVCVDVALPINRNVHRPIWKARVLPDIS
jgi:hypothetical protein